MKFLMFLYTWADFKLDAQETLQSIATSTGFAIEWVSAAAGAIGLLLVVGIVYFVQRAVRAQRRGYARH